MKQRRIGQSDKTSGWALLPLVLAAGFVPLAVHQYDYRTYLEGFDWFPDSAAWTTDFFLAYKSFFILALAVAMLAILFFQYKRKRLRAPGADAYPLFLYAALVLLSGLFSEYRAYAFRGGYELFESVWVVLSYAVFCLYAYCTVRDGADVARVLHGAGIGALLVTAVGVFQYFGLDFFRSDVGRMLITDPSCWDRLDELSFTFEEGTVYTTLYNVDYLAFYYGLLVPVLAGLFFSTKRKGLKAAYLVALALSVLCLVGSGALSGLIGLAAAALLCVCLLLGRRKRAFAVGFFAGVLLLAAGVLFGTDAGRGLAASVAGTGHFSDKWLVAGIETNDDNAVLRLRDGGELAFSYSVDGEGYFLLDVRDGEGNPVAYAPSSDAVSYELDTDCPGGCSVAPVDFGDFYGICVTLDGVDWHFSNGDGGYRYLTPAGKFTKTRDTESAELFYDDFFSGRGAIWNRTLPLLKKSLFLGTGANTFVLAYPQDDYVYSAYTGLGTTYDVKAHCWLLQQWVENGLPAVICILCLYLLYFVRSVKIYRGADLRDGTACVGLGIFLGTFAYMVVSLANDSTVCTAPVFWVLLGLGMAVNRILAEREKVSVPVAETLPAAETISTNAGGGKVGADAGSSSSKSVPRVATGSKNTPSSDAGNASNSSAGTGSTAPAGNIGSSPAGNAGNSPARNTGSSPAGNAPGKNAGTPGKQPSKKQKQSRKKKRGRK